MSNWTEINFNDTERKVSQYTLCVSWKDVVAIFSVNQINMGHKKSVR
jgi:hypothetical protein